MHIYSESIASYYHILFSPCNTTTVTTYDNGNNHKQQQVAIHQHLYLQPQKMSSFEILQHQELVVC